MTNPLNPGSIRWDDDAQPAAPSPAGIRWDDEAPPTAGPVASQLRTSADVGRTWGEAATDTFTGIGQKSLGSISGVIRGLNDRAPGAAEAQRESGFVAGLLMDVGGKVAEAGFGAHRALGQLAGNPYIVNDANRELQKFTARRAASAPEDLKQSGFAEAFAEQADEYAGRVPEVQSERARLITSEIGALTNLDGAGNQVRGTVDYFASPFLRGDFGLAGARVSPLFESLVPSLAAGGAAARLTGAAGAGTGVQAAAQLGTMSVMEGGGAAEGARGEVLGTPIKDLQAAPEFQAALRMTGGDPIRARALLADQAASISFGLGTAVAGATMGAGQLFGANVAEQAVREGVSSLATGAGVRQALMGAGAATGKEGASEFVQGASNQVAQNVGVTATGASDSLGRGVVAAGIMEGIAGAGSGAAAQAAAEVSQRLRPIDDGEDLLGGSNVRTGDLGASQPGGLALPDDPSADPITSIEVEGLRQQQLAALQAKRDGRPDQTVVDPVTGQPVTVRGESAQALNEAEQQMLEFLEKYAGRPDVLARALNRRIDDSMQPAAAASPTIQPPAAVAQPVPVDADVLLGPDPTAPEPQPEDDLLIDQAAAELRGMDEESSPIAGPAAIEPQPDEARDVAPASASVPQTAVVAAAPADPEVVDGQLPAESTFAAEREPDVPGDRASESFLPQVLSEIGWLERGGRMIRDPSTAISASERDGSDPSAGDVVGRTKWIGKPAADGTESLFWRMRPNQSLTERQAQAAVGKWREGRRLGPREQEFVDYMQKAARDYAEQWNTERAETLRSIVELEAEGITEERAELRAAALPDLTPEQEREALALQDMLVRARELGATREELVALIEQNPNRRDHAREIWHLIKQRSTVDATDQQAGPGGSGVDTEAGSRGQTKPDRAGEAAPGRAEAEPAAAPVAEPRAEGLTLSAPAAPAVTEQAAPRAQRGGLFAPPTRGEAVEGERRRRDAERNGQNANGRTDMLAGDGELFAGPRPEQVDVEQAIATELSAVEAAAAEAATSPTNDRPEPTPAQKEAGNYAKGHIRLHGLDISIENPAGTRRRAEWEPLAHHYGYFRGSTGKDGDHVDVFIGPDAENAELPVFVVDQVNKAGRFDEHKVMLGFPDEAAARKGYLANYSRGWTGLGSITQMTLADFKGWVTDPAHTSKRASEAQQPEAQSATEDAQAIDLREDGASYGKATPVLPTAESSAVLAPAGPTYNGKRVAASVPDGQLSLFLPEPAIGRERARFANRAIPVRIGSFASGVSIVNGADDAAHIIAPLRKSPQEKMVALVLDKDRKPLAVIQHSLGAVDAADVEPWSLLGAIAQVKGARSVFFAHNHPSGKVEQSDADRSVTRKLESIMRDSGIEMMGMLVVAPGSRAASYQVAGEQSSRLSIRKDARRYSVPVMERVLRKVLRGAGRAISGPNDAVDAVSATGLKSGILLLNSRHTVLGALDVDPSEAARLRSGNPEAGVMRVLAAVAEANAAAVITFGEEGPTQNVGSMLELSGVRVLDRMYRSSGAWKSAAGSSERVSATSGSLSRPRPTESREAPELQSGDRIPMGPLRSEAAIRFAVAAALDRWNGTKPIVRVVRKAADLPADAKAGDGWKTAEGYFDGADGVWLVTENLTNPQRALEVLRHEAVGHFGVERIAGAAWPSIVAAVEGFRGQKRNSMSKPMAAALAEAEARYEAAASDDPLLFAKELIAVMSETGVRASFMDRMLSQLRAFLRKTGLTGEAFSEAELRSVLSGAFRLVERGGSLAAGAPVSAGGLNSIRPDDVAAYILRMMGKNDAALFRYPKSESTSFAKVMKDVSRGEVSAVKLGEVDANFTENLDDMLPAMKWGLRMPDGSQAFVYIEQPSPYTPDAGLRMFMDASGANAGASLGSAVYAGLFQYALNTGHTFIGDPNGLSTEALLRRTEHMLSAALKHGTTRMMAPHARQVDPMDKKWGPSQDWAQPLEWTDGDDVANVTALIRTSVENHRALLKGTEADGAVYRLSDGQFVGAGGQPLTDAGLRRAAATAGERFRKSGRFAGPESRAAAVGGSTVARTLVLGSLLDRSTGSTGERRALLADLAERLSSQSLTYDRARGLFYSRPAGDESGDPPTQGGAVAEAQQNMLRGIAQGQPFDRMVRLPFAISGAVDGQGRLAKGVELTDAVRNVLLNWTPNPAGSFGWMNPMIERARAGLIDRYKLSDDYQMRDRERIAQERVISKRGGDIVKALTEAGVGLQESRVLQAVLNGEQIAEGDYAKLAAPIREAITELGREAVELGLISAETFERNKLSYLHRSYAKHEAEIEESAIKRWVDNALSSRRRKISGDSFKGRGMDKRVTMADLVRSAPADWWGRRLEKGQADKQMKGREFLIFDRLAPRGEGTETVPGIEPGGRPDRLLERHYWPADVEVPAKYAAWENRGKWEVRGVSGDQVTLWRDFTKTERERMGEIVDARYNIAKTFHVLAHDLATARFFDDIARNPEWAAKTMPTSGVIVDASEASRLRTWAGVDWVKVPDVTIPRSQAKKYGALSGRWVRAEIWRDIQELDRMHNPSSWAWVLTQWKLNKTARSPVVHMNNVVSNLLLMDMADVRLQDLVRGFDSYVKQDQNYQDALNYGAFGGSMVAAEFRRDVLQPLLTEILAESRNAGGGLDSKLKILTKITDGLHAGWKKYDKAVTWTYQAEDEIFRMATFMRRRALGDSPQIAAATALEQFLNYDIRAPWINALRRTVMPFISYTYRAVPVVAQSIAHRPWKLAKYTTIAWLVNAFGYMLAPGDEDEERRSMRSQEQGHSWVGVPRMIRMPWRDANDNPVFLDVRRWVPAGDVFDTNQGQTVLPIPAPLQFGGPLMLGAEFMLNKQAFTGKEIINPLTDTLGDRLEKVGGWAYKSWMPSAAYIPGSWYWDAVGTAIGGGRDTLGRPYSVPQAIASSVGIKARGHDIDFGFEMHELNYERTMRALKFETRILESDLDRGLISEGAFETEMRRIEQKMDRLDADIARVYGEADE